MEIKTKLFINGQWLDGDGRIPVVDPSDESVIAEVSTAGDKECDAAVAAAHTAFPSWSKTAPRAVSYTHLTLPTKRIV